MKYIILIYSNPTSWVHPLFLRPQQKLSPVEADARSDRFAELMEEIARSGELVTSEALADPVGARTVRSVGGGEVTVTDGPFIESKEQLAGYFVVDCDSLDRAVELAARFPDTVDGAVEVRPLMHPAGLEM